MLPQEEVTSFQFIFTFSLFPSERVNIPANVDDINSESPEISIDAILDKLKNPWGAASFIQSSTW